MTPKEDIVVPLRKRIKKEKNSKWGGLRDFKFDLSAAEIEYKEQAKAFKYCCNPPPCITCEIKLWAYCMATEQSCAAFSTYSDSSKVEKGVFDESC